MKTTQSQMVLPLLDALDQCGGTATPGEVYDAVAERMGVVGSARAEQIKIGGQQFNRFERDVRWAQQKAKADGLIRAPKRGEWSLTGRGSRKLREAVPGVVLTVFTTGSGFALWGAIEDAMGLVEQSSVNLMLTSPPYALATPKEYGNRDSASYVDWMTDLAWRWKELMTEDGSLVLNLGDCFERGRPTLDLYAERLLLRLVDDVGLRLAGRYEWLNTSKLPAPAEWVTIRRVRVKPALERIYWLSKGDAPKADNRQVLVPYSDSMKRVLERGGQGSAQRPSGHEMKDGAFGRDNGGAIPTNLIQAANTESNGGYMRHCRSQGLPVHPARFPKALPEFFIKMNTDPGDLVMDPFGGSMTVGEVAEGLGRRWIGVDRVLDYVLGAAGRFPGAVERMLPLPAAA